MRTSHFTLAGARTRRVLIAAVLAACPLPALAATWTGGGTSDNFSDPANWGGTALLPLDPLVFDGLLRLSPQNDFAGGTSFTGITFAPTAGAFVLGGNSITLVGDVVNSSPASQAVNTPLVLSNPTTNFTAGGTLSFGGNISGLAGNQTLSLGGTASALNTISSVISNGTAASLDVNVTGSIWALTGANSFTGNVTVSGGTFRATSGTGLPTNSLLTLSGGVFETDSNVTRALGSAPGNVRLTGNNAGFSANGGPISVALGTPNTTLQWGSPDFNPGTLTLQASTATAPLTFSHGLDLAGGTRTITTNGTNSATITGAIIDTVGGGTVVKRGGSTSVLILTNGTSPLMTNHLVLAGGQVRLDLQHNLEISGDISGSGSILVPTTTLPGSTITLSGNNSFTGSLTLQAGTFVLNSDKNLGAGTGLFQIENRAAFNTGTALLVVGGPRTITNPITHFGASANNPGLAINGEHSLTFAGPITGAAANQWYNNNLPKGQTVTFDGTLFLSNGTSARNTRFAGDGDFVVNGAIFNANGTANTAAGSNSLISKFGTGAVTINSTSLQYTGGSSITLGTMVFNRAGVLPPAVNNNGANVFIAVGQNGAVGYAGGIQDPAFLARLSSGVIAGNSVGSLAIVSNADAATDINFSAAAANWAGMGLGAANGAYTYSGVLTPLGQGWRLGGGNGTLTFSQALTDLNAAPANLTVLGGGRGTLILTSPNSPYTGSTEIRSNGTLKNGADNAIASAGTTTTVNGIYDLNGFDQSIRTIAGSGTLTASAPNSTLTIAEVAASTFAGAIAGQLGLAKTEAGTLTLAGTSSHTGTTTVDGGLLQYSGTTHSVGRIAGLATAQVAAGVSVTSDGAAIATLQIDGTHTVRPNGNATGASRIDNLAIAGTPGAWTGKLDLTNNTLLLTAPDPTAQASVLATVTDQLASGKAGGAWNGTGITSSTMTDSTFAAAHTLVVVDNGDLGATSLLGQTGLDANTTIVAVAHNGDATLDGKVDAFDLNKLAANWQTAGKTWIAGDFTGDGKVDAFDLNTLAANWQFGTAGSLEAALAAFPELAGAVAVPEPASLALLALAAPALLTRRRKEAKHL